jgi:cysteine desulfuration protein SufE
MGSLIWRNKCVSTDLFLANQHIERLKALFTQCKTDEHRYKKIIELGSILPMMHPEDKHLDCLVSGCQSQLYLKASLQEGLFVFTAHSDALISKGLAALLYIVYNNLPPALILKTPLTFLKDLSISTSLSPSRSNGLMSLYLKLQQLALGFLSDPR